MCSKHGQPSLQLMAVTRRALRRFVPAHESLELVIALFAGVFEQRHEFILTRDRTDKMGRRTNQLYWEDV